eukprot:5391264-Ditylum_brightwellii.AAC.1
MQHCWHGCESGQDIFLLLSVGPIWAVGDADKPLARSEVKVQSSISMASGHQACAFNRLVRVDSTRVRMWHSAIPFW